MAKHVPQASGLQHSGSKRSASEQLHASRTAKQVKSSSSSSSQRSSNSKGKRSVFIEVSPPSSDRYLRMQAMRIDEKLSPREMELPKHSFAADFVHQRELRWPYDEHGKLISQHRPHMKRLSSLSDVKTSELNVTTPLFLLQSFERIDSDHSKHFCSGIVCCSHPQYHSIKP